MATAEELLKQGYSLGGTEDLLSQGYSIEEANSPVINNLSNQLGGAEAAITNPHTGIPVEDFGVYLPETKSFKELAPARLAHPYDFGSAALRTGGSILGSTLGGGVGGLVGELGGSELAKILGVEPRIDVNTGKPVSTLDSLSEVSLTNPILTNLGIPALGYLAKETGVLGRASSLAEQGATKADFASDLKLGTKVIPDEFGKLRVQTRLDRAYNGVKKDGGLRGFKSAEDRFIQFKDRVGQLANDLDGHIRDIDIARKNNPIEVKFSTAEEYIKGLPPKEKKNALAMLEEQKIDYLGGKKRQDFIDPEDGHLTFNIVEVRGILDGSARTIQEEKRKIYDFLGNKPYEKGVADQEVVGSELKKAIADDLKTALEDASSRFIKNPTQKNTIKELNQKMSDYMEMYPLLKRSLSTEKSTGVTGTLSGLFNIFHIKGAIVGGASAAGFLAGGGPAALALGTAASLATSKVGEQAIGATLETLAPEIYRATQILGTPAGYAIASLLRNPNISLEVENSNLKDFVSENNRLKRVPDLLSNPILKEGLRADENVSPIIDSLGENPSEEQKRAALAQIQQLKPEVFDLSPIPGIQSAVQRDDSYYIMDPKERDIFRLTKLDNIQSSIERSKAKDALNRDGKVLPQYLNNIQPSKPKQTSSSLDSDVSSVVKTEDGDKRQEYKY